MQYQAEFPGKEQFDQNFQLTRQKIGKGNYGKVFVGIDRNTNNRVAIKLIKTKKEFNRLEYALREPQILNLIKSNPHKNIIKIIECYQWYESLKNYHKILIVMPLAFTDLQKYIDERIRGPNHNLFQEVELLDIMLQTIKGCKHLKQLYIMHRDMKPENILVMMHENKLQLLIADFGVARCYRQEVEQDNNFSHSYLAGNSAHWAPEVRSLARQLQIKKNQDLPQPQPNSNIQSQKIDFDYEKHEVWSIGLIILYAYYVGRLADNAQLLKIIRTVNLEENFSQLQQMVRSIEYPCIKEILENILLVKNSPQWRPSLSELLLHFEVKIGWIINETVQQKINELEQNNNNLLQKNQAALQQAKDEYSIQIQLLEQQYINQQKDQLFKVQKEEKLIAEKIKWFNDQLKRAKLHINTVNDKIRISQQNLDVYTGLNEEKEARRMLENDIQQIQDIIQQANRQSEQDFMDQDQNMSLGLQNQSQLIIQQIYQNQDQHQTQQNISSQAQETKSLVLDILSQFLDRNNIILHYSDIVNNLKQAKTQQDKKLSDQCLQHQQDLQNLENELRRQAQLQETRSNQQFQCYQKQIQDMKQQYEQKIMDINRQMEQKQSQYDELQKLHQQQSENFQKQLQEQLIEQQRTYQDEQKQKDLKILQLENDYKKEQNINKILQELINEFEENCQIAQDERQSIEKNLQKLLQSSVHKAIQEHQKQNNIQLAQKLATVRAQEYKKYAQRLKQLCLKFGLERGEQQQELSFIATKLTKQRSRMLSRKSSDLNQSQSNRQSQIFNNTERSQTFLQKTESSQELSSSTVWYYQQSSPKQNNIKTQQTQQIHQIEDSMELVGIDNFFNTDYIKNYNRSQSNSDFNNYQQLSSARTSYQQKDIQASQDWINTLRQCDTKKIASFKANKSLKIDQDGNNQITKSVLLTPENMKRKKLFELNKRIHLLEQKRIQLRSTFQSDYSQQSQVLQSIVDQDESQNDQSIQTVQESLPVLSSNEEIIEN